MPASGGAADKLGNRYEALWAVDQLLRVVDGTARQITSEPLAPDESRGIEFTVDKADGTRDFWSVKRQTTSAAGWTLAGLAARDDRGRSILGDLLRHVERDPANHAVFASTQSANDLQELANHAESKAIFNARLDRSDKIKSDFHQYVLPLFGGDTERARAFLLRVRTHAADEAQLRDRVTFAIRKIFYATDGSPLDAAAVLGHILDLLLNKLHLPLDRNAPLSMLTAHGIRLRDWAVEPSVVGQIDKLCVSYLAPLLSLRINGTFLPLSGGESILGADGKPAAKKVLVVRGS